MTPSSHRRWYKFSLRTLFAVVGVLCCGLALLNWAFHRAVPYGVRSSTAYFAFSIDRGIASSPNDMSQVRIISNDAGAMHSGHFWTWIIVDRWWGSVVVAQGYLEESRGNVPLTWLDDHSFEIEFCQARYGAAKQTTRVEL